MTYVIAYLATATLFLAVDALWLGVVARTFYVRQIGHLMADIPRLWIAGAFYAVYVIGILIFAVLPALSSGSWQTALIYGALFGFFAYATYDLTNMATLRDWSVAMVVVDVAWGTALTGLSALSGYLVTAALT